MSIVYCLIGKDADIFCQYTNCSGNFPLIAIQVLKACDDRKYVKYSTRGSNGYLFYVLNIQCTFMVMCSASYSQRIVFNFLENIRKLFIDVYDPDKILNAKMYDMMNFAPVLKREVELYNKPEQIDKLALIQKQTDEVNKIIQEDIEKILALQPKITAVVQRTEEMVKTAFDYKSNSRVIRNDMIFENWKMKICIGCAIMGVIYFILILSCGGF